MFSKDFDTRHGHRPKNFSGGAVQSGPPPTSWVETQPGSSEGAFPSYREPPPDRSIVRHADVGSLEIDTVRPGRKFSTRVYREGGGHSALGMHSGIFPPEGKGQDMHSQAERLAMSRPGWAMPPLSPDEFGA